MDTAILILVPSILGGLAIALLIARLQGRGSSMLSDVSMERSPSTDVINISRIRAAGIGGLGLFAMALVVAWFVPRIGLTLGAGVLFGALLGVVMILRRRTGPLPSSGGSAGANVVLSIDHPAASENKDTKGPPNGRRAAQAPRLA